jgi:dihydrofolate reductase
VKLIVNEFLSLDGVMQAPGDPDEDRTDGFAHGGWQRPYFDGDFAKVAFEGMRETDGYLFGRRTYEIMAAFWPSKPKSDPFAASLNGLPKYVGLDHPRRAARMAELDVAAGRREVGSSGTPGRPEGHIAADPRSTARARARGNGERRG